MRTALYLSFISIVATCSVSAQYYTYSRTSNGTNSIVIPNGEAWQIVNWTSTGGWNDYYFKLSSAENIVLGGTSGAFLSLENPASSQPIGAIIQGPNVLRAQSVVQSSAYEYYMVLKKISNIVSNSISATSVVIPSSAAGDVDVKLEQSADNVTWTECLPGTYNSSTVKRFFRLRAVEK
jgi:hypothetical protein